MTIQTTDVGDVSRSIDGCGLLPVEDLTGVLDHRAPFLFLDRAAIRADLSEARGVRKFSDDEWYFRGHFPDDAIVPGVLLLEVAAQTANVLLSARAGRLVHGYLVSTDAASFKGAVRPGDTVTSVARLARDKAAAGPPRPGGFFVFQTTVLRGAQPCLRAMLTVFWAERGNSDQANDDQANDRERDQR